MIPVVVLTQTGVAAEHVQDSLAALHLVAAAVTRAPLGHLGAAVAHVVGSHDGACLCGGDKSRSTGANPQSFLCNIPLGQKTFICSAHLNRE